jgi:hypothetical protein
MPPLANTLQEDGLELDFPEPTPTALPPVLQEDEELSPSERARYLLVKAKSYLLQDRTSEAIRSLEQAIKLDGDSPGCLRVLAAARSPPDRQSSLVHPRHRSAAGGLAAQHASRGALGPHGRALPPQGLQGQRAGLFPAGAGAGPLGGRPRRLVPGGTGARSTSSAQGRTGRAHGQAEGNVQPRVGLGDGQHVDRDGLREGLLLAGKPWMGLHPARHISLAPRSGPGQDEALTPRPSQGPTPLFAGWPEV